MQHTTNLNLNKPEASDYADIAALNENMDTLDTAVAGKVDADGLADAVKELVQEGGLTAADLGAVDADTVGQPGGVAGYEAFQTHAADAGRHLTDGERAAWNAKGEPYAAQLTLTTGGWSGSGPYTQTAAAAGITADLTPVADVVLSSDTAAAKLQLEAWGCVSRMETLSGQVKATCLEEKPGVNLTVQLAGCKEGSV